MYPGSKYLYWNCICTRKINYNRFAIVLLQVLTRGCLGVLLLIGFDITNIVATRDLRNENERISSIHGRPIAIIERNHVEEMRCTATERSSELTGSSCQRSWENKFCNFNWSCINIAIWMNFLGWSCTFPVFFFSCAFPRKINTCGIIT